MIRLRERSVHSDGNRPAADVYRRWIERFGPLVAEQLDADRRYTLMRVRAADFAFTDNDAYTRALGQVWAAGLVPEPRPSALGRELTRVAPNLRGVDPDLADLRASDVEPGHPHWLERSLSRGLRMLDTLGPESHICGVTDEPARPVQDRDDTCR
jgi:hypothetical protein